MISAAGVCVINYNTRDHLRACLQGLRDESPASLIVVDNASHDGSADMVRQEFPDVKLIANTANLGFAAAANQAIAACESPFLLLLNSDTLVPTGWIERLADARAGRLSRGIAPSGGRRTEAAESGWDLAAVVPSISRILLLAPG